MIWKEIVITSGGVGYFTSYLHINDICRIIHL